MRPETDSFVYRATVLATLVFMAVGFAFFAEQDNPKAKQQNTPTDPSAKEVGSPKSLWVRTVEDAPSFWTAVLAGLTIVLAGAAAGQIYYLRRADATSRISARAALVAARAAQRSARTAENALIGSDAPFVFPVVDGSFSDGRGMGFGRYAFHNYGRSPALVREVEFYALLSSGLPAPFGFMAGRSTPLHKLEIIPAGESNTSQRIKDDTAVPSVWGQIDEAPNEAHWVIGQVRYTDTLGTQYLSGFCLVYNAFTGKFQAQGGSAHNYRRRLSEAETAQAEAVDAELPPYLRPPGTI